MEFEDYSLEEHKHRVASWAAATAAKASPKCRFPVEYGKEILEEIGLNRNFGLNDLPNPEEFDNFHRRLREAAVNKAGEMNIQGFTHGVAAKLINIYLKMIFTCGGHHEEGKVKAVHPPIDRVLLNGLVTARVGNVGTWRTANGIGWSSFSSVQYETVMKEMRKNMVERNCPVWKIEACWVGHQ
jgi:hypothetical protein